MSEPALKLAQPLCPLHGIPPMQRAWSAKPGDTIILRLNSWEPKAFDAARKLLDLAEERSGIQFLLIGPNVEVVPPDGADV